MRTIVMAFAFNLIVSYLYKNYYQSPPEEKKADVPSQGYQRFVDDAVSADVDPATLTSLGQTGEVNPDFRLESPDPAVFSNTHVKISYCIG